MFILLLIIIEILLFAVNYVHGTYLIGWDNIMPEFNLLLNFKRSLLGVWQDYRGLGLLDGLSYTANLMHVIYVSILSLILPQAVIRYVFIFLMHLAGGIGFYYLTRYLTKNNKASFLGATFYMLNIGIIQMFFAPLEVFAIHFASLPFLALFITKTFKNPTKKNYLLLFLTMILTTPQAFVPTVFIAFFIFFFFLLIFQYFETKNFKTVLLVFFILIGVNAFWMLPYAYSTKNNAAIIQNTRINQFSSEEIFYRNKAFGSLTQVLGLNGFMINAVEYDADANKSIYFLDAWRKHQDNVLYKVIYLIIIGIGTLGAWKIIKGRKSEYYPYLASLIIAFFFLANNTPILEQLNTLIRNALPIVGEVLRFPFTKFITLFAFCFSMLFTLGLTFIFERVKFYAKYLSIVIFTAIIFLALPAFSGQFISPLLKVRMPQDYKLMMNYLDTVDENQRIALLPAYTFWNWEYRTWGQRGSDFIWYGIKQPLLMRHFDPWSYKNEQFYNELSYAMNLGDINLFHDVLKKYDVSYLLLDQYFINNLSTKPINYDQIHRFLSSASSFMMEEKGFNNLILYKIKDSNSGVYSLNKSTTATINSIPLFTKKDQVFEDVGNYITANNQNGFFYPFYSTFTGKSGNGYDDFMIDENQKTFTFISKKAFQLTENGSLEIPSVFNSEYLIPVKIDVKNGQLILNIISPNFFINDQKVDITEDPIIITPKTVKNPKNITLTDIQHTITPGQKSYIRTNYINTIKLVDNTHEELITINTQNINRNNFVIPVNAGSLNIKAVIEKINSPLTYENILGSKDYNLIVPAKELLQIKQKDSSVKIDDKKNVIFNVKSDSAELTTWKPNLPHQASYLISTVTKHISGLPLTFYIDNPFEKRAEFETRLSKSSEKQFVILPKTENYFEGYGFHFIDKSLGNENAKNNIEGISIYPIPFETLKMTKIVRQDSLALTKNDTKMPLNFKKDSSFQYEISIPQNLNDSYIVLDQAYNDGWKAYADGKEIKDHILVNNWANGWDISNIQHPTSITLIFWPQYLEFVGFGLMFLALLIIILKRK